MPNDKHENQSASGDGDKGRNQPEKGNKIGANDKDHRHDGGSKTGNQKNV